MAFRMQGLYRSWVARRVAARERARRHEERVRDAQRFMVVVRRAVLVLQSVLRMWPRRQTFRRQIAAAIRLQVCTCVGCCTQLPRPHALPTWEEQSWVRAFRARVELYRRRKRDAAAREALKLRLYRVDERQAIVRDGPHDAVVLYPLL